MFDALDAGTSHVQARWTVPIWQEFSRIGAGHVTEAIAYHFDQYILSSADFYVDLHSGGVKCAIPTLIGYLETDRAAAAAAEIFGAPVIWCHPDVPPGRMLSAAINRRIPCLYAEARGAGRIDPGNLSCYRCGILKVLKHLGIIPGCPEVPDRATRLYGDGNVDGSISSESRRLLMPRVQLLDTSTAIRSWVFWSTSPG